MPLKAQQRPVFAGDEAQTITRAEFPNSSKVYRIGSQPGIRVAMRQVRQSPTLNAKGEVAEENPAITLYDTSGPYTDPEVTIELRKGLTPLRLPWISQRGEVDELEQVSSEYGRARARDPELEAIRFPNPRKPLRARSSARVTQMHYARRGEITPEMEYIAIRESMRAEKAGAGTAARITPEFVRDEVARGRAIES